MIEEWRPVVDWEGLYEVSNLGRIKSLPKYRFKGKILKTYKRNKKTNHLTVMLQDKSTNRCKNLFVHRLVAEAFIPNPNNYPIINHKDENPENNCVDNLEWCDYKYNSNYGSCSRKIGDALSTRIGRYTKDGLLIEVLPSMNEATRRGWNQSHICQCCKGERYTAYGYIWRYIA